MALVRPKSYPIRDLKSNAQAAGQVYNPVRYSELGGLSGPSKYGSESPFGVEAPMKGTGSGEKGGKAPY